MSIPDAFFQLFHDASPALHVKFWNIPEEQPVVVHVEHCLRSKPTAKRRAYLETLRKYDGASELCGFYKKHDGLELCKTHDSRYREVRPLLQLKPAATISQFTSRYRPEGDLAWSIDLNKSKKIYRGSDSWIAFAEVDSGPACLTIFLDGDNAGKVFFVTPQPRFNILQPIAKSYNALLERIATDLAAFLRLVHATVTIRGADGENYGFSPIEYVAAT